MSISNVVFILKPSRYAWFFQLSVVFILLFVSFQSLSWWGWGIFIVLIMMSFWFYSNTYPKLHHFSYLGEMQWTLKFVKGIEIKHSKLQQIIDHRVYIVLYWSSESKPTVIWCDQLDLTEWKKLKVLAQLHTPTLKLE